MEVEYSIYFLFSPVPSLCEMCLLDAFYQNWFSTLSSDEIESVLIDSSARFAPIVVDTDIARTYTTGSEAVKETV